MEARKAAANGQAAQGETQAARERAADERQVRADEQQRLAEERQRKADEREAGADERETRADERERLADERERLADERERAVDQREAGLDERERELVARGQHLSMAIEDLEQRTRATIERSRALLARSGKRLDRGEEAVKRSRARREREQADIDRASAEAERGLTTWLPDPGPMIERSRRLRQQALTAIEAFAATEEQIARVHEDLAASKPGHREEYRRVARQARDTARRAREIIRSVAADPQGQLARARRCPHLTSRAVRTGYSTSRNHTESWAAQPLPAIGPISSADADIACSARTDAQSVIGPGGRPRLLKAAPRQGRGDLAYQQCCQDADLDVGPLGRPPQQVEGLIGSALILGHHDALSLLDHRHARQPGLESGVGGVMH